jgi:GMP synthase (glutamine-hydrolysing)
VAAVAAGGTVRINPKGREIGVARKITLTEAGRAHPMHERRPLAFDAPTVHSDEVGVPPGDILVTAANAVTDVQAAEIRHEGGIFWGVQYHPEYGLAEIAATLRRYGMRLIDDGFFWSLDELEAHAALYSALDENPGRRDLAWRLGIDADVLDPLARMTEIANWLSYCVRPAKSRRGRA